MKKILIVGQTPPPFGGQAAMIQKLLDGTYKNVQLIHVRMEFSKDMQEMGKVKGRKLFHLLYIILKIYFLKIVNNVNVIYYPPSGPDKTPVFRDMIILIATRWLFTKTIFHFHAGGLSSIYNEMNRLEKYFFKMAYFNPDASIVMSEKLSDSARFLNSKKIFIIPYGIPDYLQPSLEVESKSHFPAILFVGLLRETKGEYILAKACAILKNININFRANIVGRFDSLESEQRFIEFIKKNKLEKNILYCGVLIGNEKNKIFSEADIFCFPTFFESEAFPVVLIEAMSFGLPIVSTKWRGIPEMVVDKENGFLVDIKDEKAIADKLAKLICDENLRKEMGMNGRKRYLENYTEEKYHSNLEKCFVEISNV